MKNIVYVIVIVLKCFSNSISSNNTLCEWGDISDSMEWIYI